MPVKWAHAACMHHKVAEQHSILHYTLSRLAQHITEVSLGMHALGKNLIHALSYEF